MENIMRKFAIAFAALCATFSAGAANAASIVAGADEIESYVLSRLVDQTRARIHAGGELYRARAVINGEEWSGWAMDVAMNVRLAPGRRTGPHRRAVLLGANGPIALNTDVRRFKRLD